MTVACDECMLARRLGCYMYKYIKIDGRPPESQPSAGKQHRDLSLICESRAV
jgi:hypothetical protein